MKNKQKLSYRLYYLANWFDGMYPDNPNEAQTYLRKCAKTLDDVQELIFENKSNLKPEEIIESIKQILK